LPPLTAELFAVAPELEAGIDDLWARITATHAAADENVGRILLVAHWTPGEGGTTVAAALACRAAELDPERSFCLVDFDFFNPGLTSLTGLETESGVCNVLAGRDGLESALAPSGTDNLLVMPVGYPNLGRRVHTLADRCRHLVGLLQERFHYVVIDLPQLAAWSRASLWAGGLGQAVLVVRAGQADRATVSNSLRLLRRLRLDVAGIVLNGQDLPIGAESNTNDAAQDEWESLDLTR
jgi:Mrp family chromosome partitioning ATPase